PRDHVLRLISRRPFGETDSQSLLRTWLPFLELSALQRIGDGKVFLLFTSSSMRVEHEKKVPQPSLAASERPTSLIAVPIHETSPASIGIDGWYGYEEFIPPGTTLRVHQVSEIGERFRPHLGGYNSGVRLSAGGPAARRSRHSQGRKGKDDSGGNHAPTDRPHGHVHGAFYTRRRNG
ncbi:MAG: hypothetical protein Q9179_007996, partial [Wetmoreana sp. 5 TL-2023]